MSKNLYKDKDWLYQKHVEEGLTNVEIAEICDVSDGTICRWKNKLGVPSNGHNRPKRVKDKIAESVSEHLEENGHPFEGEEHTDETKEIMSEKKTGENHHYYGEDRPEFAEQMTGDDNPSWKGGITKDMDFRKSNKWQTFSTDKKEEANWECENCSTHGSESEIHSHHVKHVSSGGAKYDNIFIVLCKECHKTNYEFWHNSSVEEQLSKVGR